MRDNGARADLEDVRAAVDGALSDPARADLLADGALSVRQAASFAGIGVTSLYKAMSGGELEWCTIGRRRVIPKAALRGFLARRLRGGWAREASQRSPSDKPM